MASALICDDATIALECLTCSDQFPFTRKTGSGRFPRFCSVDCRGERLKRQKQQYAAEGRHSGPNAYHRKHPGWSAEQYRKKVGRLFTCKKCGVEFRSKQHVAAYCSTDCMAAALKALNTKHPERYCAKCGDLFKPARTNRRQRAAGYVQKHCSYECAGQTAPTRAPNRKARKAALRSGGYWHPVNPITVFDRDGWRCHLCGRKTPKDLRGTTDDRAPELDHIVPLAAGGDHSYENAACACRRCNREKGARPLGQMLLFG